MPKRQSGGGRGGTRKAVEKKTPVATSARRKRGRRPATKAATDDGDDASSEEGGAKTRARSRPTKRLRTRPSPALDRDPTRVLPVPPSSSSSSSSSLPVAASPPSSSSSSSAPPDVAASPTDDVAPPAPKPRAPARRARPPEKPVHADAVPAELDRRTAERIVSKVTRTALAEWIVEHERARLEANGHDSVRPHHQADWVRAQKYAVLRPLAVRMLLATPGAGINLARVGPALRSAKKREAEQKRDAAKSATAAELARLAKARRAATNGIARRRKQRLLNGTPRQHGHPRLEDGTAPANSDDDTASDDEQEGAIRRMSKPALLEWCAYKTASDAERKSEKKAAATATRQKKRSRKRTARKKTSKKNRSNDDDDDNDDDEEEGDGDEEDENLVGDPTAMRVDALRRRVLECKKTHGDVQVLEALWEAQSRDKTSTATLWRRKGDASRSASVALVRKTVAMANEGATFMVRIVERWTGVRDLTFDDDSDRGVSAAPPSSSSSLSSPLSASSSSSVGARKTSRSAQTDGGADDVRTRVGLEFQRVVPVRVVACWPRADAVLCRATQPQTEFVVALESDSSGWGRTLAVSHVLMAGTEIKYKIDLATSSDVGAKSGDAAWQAHIPLFASNVYASLSSRITFGDVANASTLVRDAIAKRVHDAMHQVAHYSRTVANLVGEYAIGGEAFQPPPPPSSSPSPPQSQKSSVDDRPDRSSASIALPVSIASDDDDRDDDGVVYESDDSDSSGVDTGDDGENDEAEPRKTRASDEDDVEIVGQGGSGEGGAGGGGGGGGE